VGSGVRGTCKPGGSDPHLPDPTPLGSFVSGASLSPGAAYGAPIGPPFRLWTSTISNRPSAITIPG